MGDGRAAQARLIGEDTPGHAKLNGQHDAGAGKTALGGGTGKGLLHDQAQSRRYLGDIEQDD